MTMIIASADEAEGRAVLAVEEDADAEAEGVVEGSDPDREAAQRRPGSSLSCTSQSKIDRTGCRMQTANGQTLALKNNEPIVHFKTKNRSHHAVLDDNHNVLNNRKSTNVQSRDIDVSCGVEAPERAVDQVHDRMDDTVELHRKLLHCDRPKVSQVAKRSTGSKTPNQLKKTNCAACDVTFGGLAVAA
mmetsp:Transcript_26234/g.43933  ORF Transcript_26234/g.43933 Transcript_26234/m.43933 type:complete len:188 (+) Transcript_26234:353-916(+)